MTLGWEDVSFAYGEQVILQNFSLALPERGGLCLFGASGCGKTTALRLLAGLEQPQAGRMKGMTDRRPAVLFQEDRLLPWRTLAQNVALVSEETKARDWLARVGLADEADKLPTAVSGGQRRRAALARALAFDGDLLMLDEPLKGLDAATAERMRALIKEAAREKPLLLVTHDRTEAEALCRHIVELGGPPLRMIAK